MTKDEALKLALDRLIWWENGYGDPDESDEVITAIKQALVRADERRANIACIGRIAALVGDPIDQARLFEAIDAIRARGETK